MLKNITNKVTPDILSKWLFFILLSAAAITLGVLTLYFYNFPSSISEKNDNWGTFGDFFGGTINPLLSFLSLMALLLTILLQSKEQERSAVSQENSEKYLIKQESIQQKQQFERTFFALLEQNNLILEKITSPNVQFSDNKSNLEYVHQRVFDGQTQYLANVKYVLERNNSFCGHYFRNLYQVLKFIAINCLELGDHIPIRSLPYFKARRLLSTLLIPVTSPPAP